MRKLIIITLVALMAIIGAAVGTMPTQLSGTTPDVFKTVHPPQSENSKISDAMQRVAMQQPGIYNSLVSVDDSHMGITIQRGVTGNDNAIADAIRQIIANYAWFAVHGYRGYLSIGLVNDNNQVVNVWEVTAADAVAHVKNSVISTDWVESRLNAYTGIRYYWADRYGDITKTVDTSGGPEPTVFADTWMNSQPSNDVTGHTYHGTRTPPSSSMAVGNVGGSYLANSDTKVYHYPSCAWAQKILPENRRWFSNPNEARSAGYRPCEKCNPP
jgi:hypothetical protein